MKSTAIFLSLFIPCFCANAQAQDQVQEFVHRQEIGRDLKHYKALEFGGVEMRMDKVAWYRTLKPPAWTLSVSFAGHYSETENPNGFLWEPSCQINSLGQPGIEFLGTTKEGFTVRVPGDIEAFAWKCEGITKLKEKEKR